MKTTKILILLLLIDAGAVFVMQCLRWGGAFVFVALYWAILTAKNYLDWRHSNAKDNNRRDRS